MFVDEISGEKAVFTYKPDSTVVARGNYDNPLPELWQSIGVATTSYNNSCFSVTEDSTLDFLCPVIQIVTRVAADEVVIIDLHTSSQRLLYSCMQESPSMSMDIRL